MLLAEEKMRGRTGDVMREMADGGVCGSSLSDFSLGFQLGLA